MVYKLNLQQSGGGNPKYTVRHMEGSDWSKGGLNFFGEWHRKSMGTEAKAKIVTSILGGKFVQFLAAQAVLPPLIWKKQLNSPVYAK